MNRQETLKLVVGVVSMAFMLAPHAAHAKGSAPLSVITTGAAAGTVVSGTVAITNTTTKAATAATMVALEVRFPTGSPVPALPPGSTSGYYWVANVSLPPAVVPPLATVSIPYTIDTCGAQVTSYRGAKDMRADASVTAGTQVESRSANFAAPSQSYCPVCGNGIREGTEQCDGTPCCTPLCVSASDGTVCNDGNQCTQTDRCQAGSCIGSDPVVCVARDQCHIVGMCDPVTGACSSPFKANGTPCDDGNACSTGDACANGQCIGSPIVCNDGNVCTTDSCSNGRCIYVNNSDPCDDGSVCTVGDSCSNGVCIGNAPRDCNDHKACTDDVCDEVTACTHTSTPTCDACHADECVLCQDDCAAATANCENGCWQAFWDCLNRCTTTYCAPFCQFDLGRCLDACPDQDICASGCESGNGCVAGCNAPQP